MTAQDLPENPICQILTPVGMLGCGFDADLMTSELASLVTNGVPTAIILDSGSTDSGPEKLALGNMSNPRTGYVRDLSKLLKLVHTFRVPLLFSSSGGDGTDEHVGELGRVIEEICAEEENKAYRFKTISIFSDIDKATVLERLKTGKVTGCGTCVPALRPDDIASAKTIVAQIGSEPYIDAMTAHPDFDVILGGRSYDPAPYAAYCAWELRRQQPHLTQEQVEERFGGFIHMGKIMECGGLCGQPKSHGAVATVYASGLFDVRPTAPGSLCTPLSVAAHALYENARPDILHGPGGALLLDDSQYEQLADGRSVRVCGSKFQSCKSDGDPYRIKLEGAKTVGYRSIFMGGIKDPILIEEIDFLIAGVREYLEQQFPHNVGQFDAHFHVYGKGQTPSIEGSGVFVIAEILADTQELANSLVAKARVYLIHGPYPGQKATAGNVGFGLGGKLDVEMGPCAQFCVYHLMELNPGEERLRSTFEAAETPTGLLRASVNVVGRGTAVDSDTLLRTRFGLPNTVSNGAHTNGTSPFTQRQTISSDNPHVLSDLCHVIRSKNAGPYEITLDAMFSTKSIYHTVKDSGLLSPESVANELGVSPWEIIWQGFFEPALSFKVTIPRFRGGVMSSAGSFRENDIHGSQQHLGLASLKLPKDISFV